MRRRDVITLLGGAAAGPSVLWPLVVRAQQPRRVGVLMNSVATDPEAQSYMGAFVQTLRNLGWAEGQNLRVDYRWNAGNAERARTYAAELVALAPDVILSASTTNLAALRQATRTIPVVFTIVSDPVAQGFVPSLAQPGSNITGFSNYEFSMGGKWLNLLKQIAPDIARVAVMFNPDTSPQSNLFLRSIEAAAPSFGVQVLAFPVRTIGEIESKIENFSRQPNGGLLFPTDSFLILRRELIVDLAARHRLPAIYPNREFVTAGGLMRYGIDYVEQFRQAASYVDRILKGTKPGDLPIQLPIKFVLAINLKAARALGLEIPIGLLLIADEQIE